MSNYTKFQISSILNIDSYDRSKYPKHIYKSDNKFLPSNPLYFKKGSNIVQINYPNHSLSSGDNIIIQNVEGNNIILVDSFYLINKFKYLLITLYDNGIDTDYKNYVDELNIHIELYGPQIENNMLNNIPFNSLLGVKNILLYNDIPDTSLSAISSTLSSILGSSDVNFINKNCIFIELDNEYINQDTSYIKINQVFNLSYLHISGIKLGYLNANYPINNYNYQSSYLIYSVIDEDHFEIMTNYFAYGTLSGGGNKVQIMKIINSINGYPDPDDYFINLKKSFNNVVKIELLSTEFPYVDIVIKENENDKLYWKHIEDGDVIYQIKLDDGNYTQSTLIDNIKTKMNAVERTGSTKITPKYNYFDVELDMKLQLIKFMPYNLTNIPNSLSLRLETINSNEYYILNISNDSLIINSGETVIISSSDDVTIKNTLNNITEILSVASSYINKSHSIYSINLENQTYDIILGKKSEIKTTVVDYESGGGENIIIKNSTKASFYFNYPDTCGDILGFKYVGDKTSIIDFSSVITNKDDYINSNNLNYVGNNLNYSNGFINLSGKFNYFLMYLNDIEYVYQSNNLPSAFAKILLDGNPGDILFDNHVKIPGNTYSKNFPISTLTELHIRFLYPDGSRVNFRNLEHSFTLNIIEEKIQNNNTYLNSKTMSFIEEIKKI
jgi:hypothetical protein